jgi:GT2 family glycosyltransferase
MQKYSDLSAISTRGIVPFDHPRKIKLRNSRLRQVINFPSRKFPEIFAKTYLGPFKSGIGFFGDTSSPPFSRLKFSKRASRTIFIGEAVVRGPILWRSDHLKLVNGFNDVAYFLGWDDYDASFRLFTVFNFRVAYLPSKAHSRVNSGTNSFTRSEETKLEYKRREDLASKFPGSISKYWFSREDENSEIKIKWERRKI